MSGPGISLFFKKAHLIVEILLLHLVGYPALAGPQQKTEYNTGIRPFHVSYYRLNLRIATSPNRIHGQVLAKIVGTGDSLRTIKLDLIRSTMLIDSVTVAGRKSTFVQDSATFTIMLDRVYHRGEAVTTGIFYHNTYDGRRFGDFVFATFGTDNPWIWSTSETEMARFWWPCNDHPSDKADSVDMIVTVDRNLKVGSNGILVSVTDNPDRTRTYHWHESYPIATYLVSVAIADYAAYSDWWKYTDRDSMEILNYVFPADLEDAKENFSCVRDGLTIFSRLFGRYPFAKEKYGVAECGAGLENQTMISLALRHWSERNIIHELAHQWFGDMITCRTWSELWLNEGFTEYCNALYLEQKHGASEYRAFINDHMAQARNASGSLHLTDTTDPAKMFEGPLVYFKGASVLHMLRRILGDSLFFKVLYEYANDPHLKYATATTEDFRAVCERTSGKDLGYFFDEWVYGEGHPTYKYSWTSEHSGNGESLTVRIRQFNYHSKPDYFIMPVDLKIWAGGKDSIITLWNDKPDQIFQIQWHRKPSLMILDPGNWILK